MTPAIQPTSSAVDAARQALRDAGLFTISLVGGPGCGKTSLIEATIARLAADVHVGVVTCGVASRRDAERVGRHHAEVAQLYAGPDGSPRPADIAAAVHRLGTRGVGLLFIENAGSLTTPPDHALGQDLTVTMFSVAAGDDKADKHPQAVRASDVVILNKTDLCGPVPFNVEAFMADLHRINPHVKVFPMSALRGHGADEWADWLRTRVKARRDDASHWFG